MTQAAKIIVIGPGYPYRNGQSIYLSALCNELSREFNIELINYTLLYPKFLFPGSTQYDESRDRKITFPNKRMLHSLNPTSWLRTARYINTQNPDMVAIDWWHPFFGFCCWGLTRCLSKKLRKKVVFITENVISHEANPVDHLLTRIGLGNAQCFLALSTAVEQHLRSLFQKRVFRSALPIYDFYQSAVGAQDTAVLKKRFGFRPTDTVFLFFGLIRHYKGLDLLLETFAAVAKQHSDVRLLIVGEFYEPAAPYQSLIKKLEIASQVYLENRYIPDEQVSDYFNASDCVVLPYRSATQSGILSMAYGFKKPVIVTDVGELAALVIPNETGLVAKHPGKEDLQRAMTDFLKLQEQALPFSENITGYLRRKDKFKEVNRVFSRMLRYLQEDQR